MLVALSFYNVKIRILIIWHSLHGHGLAGWEASLIKYRSIFWGSAEDQLNSAIAWPWDEDCDIETFSDHFKTSILTIKAKMANLETVQGVPDSGWIEYDFNEEKSRPNHIQCILIWHIKEGRKNLHTGTVTELTHIAMAVEQYGNGVYYRTGLIELRKAQWEAAEVVTKMIQLG
jgi:hypothetical protein